MTSNTPFCIHCGRSVHAIPLIRFEYQDAHYWICPQHLPILIHQPAILAEKLPGIELIPSEEENS